MIPPSCDASDAFAEQVLYELWGAVVLGGAQTQLAVGPIAERVNATSRSQKQRVVATCTDANDLGAPLLVTEFILNLVHFLVAGIFLGHFD